MNTGRPGDIRVVLDNISEREKLEQELSKSYPLRRVGRPEDIARAVLFFASRQADWITGQVLFVGGGNRM